MGEAGYQCLEMGEPDPRLFELGFWGLFLPVNAVIQQYLQPEELLCLPVLNRLFKRFTAGVFWDDLQFDLH